VSKVTITEASRELVVCRGFQVPRSLHAKVAQGFEKSVEVVDAIFFADEDGTLTTRYLEIRGRGFDQTALATLPLNEWAEAAYSTFFSDPAYQVVHQTVSMTAREWTQKAAEIGKQFELEQVAWVYLMAPTRGTTNVMESMGYGSKTTAIRRVMEARKAGLIPSPEADKEEYAKALNEIRKKRLG
jgi:hypothetical protein